MNSNLNLNLSKDSRTIMHTPRHLTIQKMDEDGQYWHNGLEVCLNKILGKISHPMTISLNINTDGLPLFNSSTKNFWPILFNIDELPKLPPMVIGIYYGAKVKPTDITSFFGPFIDELIPILESGLTINGHHVSVRIRCFICDSPARAFIKGVVSFNAKFGCLKCVTKGKYSHISRTMTFPEITAAKRTNTMFRAKQYEDHQKTATPLIRLPIDMIEDIVVSDSLHLLELGVMRKLMKAWRTGCMSMRTKWSCKQKAEISSLLEEIKLPNEIHRKMRSLDYISLWKGLEYRNFLNYISIVLLKDFLPPKYFHNVVILFCAVRICSAKKYRHLLPVAKALFADFISDYKLLYGTENVTSNIHNLCHVVDEVERFGCLQTLTAYPFESYLHQLKKMVKPGSNALAQAAARISEGMLITPVLDILVDSKEKFHGVEIKQTLEHKLVLSSFILSNKFEDQWFLSKDKSVICFTKVIEKNSHLIIEGQELVEKHNYFETPFSSQTLHIYIADSHKRNLSKIKQYSSENILCKLVALPRNEGTVFIPLIHTIL